MTKIVKSVCSHDCPDACSVLIHVEQELESGERASSEKATQFRGDPDHPVTRGFLCGKVNAYEQVVYSEDRVLHPLKRSGPKGSGEFQRISWDDALDEIAEKIRSTVERSGGEALAQYFYAGTMGVVHRFCAEALFHKLGATRQIPNICFWGADAGYTAAVGSGYGVDIEDAAHSDFIVVWGCNVATTQVHLIPFIDEARKSGAKLIVIDPYRNRTAKMADEWISVEPGTDTALALGLMHVIEREALADKSFVEDRTQGYDMLCEQVLPKYSPEATEKITGVPAATIEDLARRLAKANTPLFKIGIGLGRSSHGASASRAVSCLAGQLGAYEKLGGGALYDSGSEFRFNLNPLTRPDWLEKDTRRFRQTDFGALLNLDDNPVEFLFVHGANPMATAPEQNAIRRGLLREDLFTVVHERFLTDTAKYADIVLPAVTFAESSDLFKSYGHLYAQFARQAIQPVGEARDNLSVIQAIGKRLGFTDDWFDQSVEDFTRAIFAASDHPNLDSVDVDKLLAGEAQRLAVPRSTPGFAKSFATPSGKLEFYSESLEASHGLGLLDYRGDLFNEDPETYPLRLITPPAHAFLNSSFNELAKSRRREGGRPRALIHPDDAPAGLETGMSVVLENTLGAARVVAVLSEDTRPGTIVAEGTWWPTWADDGNGINTLTSSRLTDFGEGSTFHDNHVRLKSID